MSEITTQTMDIEDKTLLAYVVTSLTSQGFIFTESVINDVPVLHFTGSKYQITANIFCGSQFLTFHAVLPFAVSELISGKVVQELNTINIGLPIGGFELHQGRILFKTGLTIPPKPSPTELATIIYQVVGTANEYADRISAVIS